MKGKRYLLVGLFFGSIIGWTLGFLRLPYIENNYSFLLGLLTALASVSLVLIVLRAGNGNFLSALIGRKIVGGVGKSTRAHTFSWIIILGVLLSGCVLGGVAIYSRNEAFRWQIQEQHKQLQAMTAVIVAGQKKSLEPLIHSLLDDVAAEVKQHSHRTLSDTIIDRIAAVSFSFQPYKYLEADTLSKQGYSPERGQLLQALLLMNIDSGAFGRIKRKTIFAGADLRSMDLKGLDLSGINLREANLQGVNLSGANLQGAQLEGANLWGANLNHANLRQVDLKRANLSWAQLNEATLPAANLNGANLTNAQLKKADLNDATFQWTLSVGALYNEANLTGVDFVGTDFTRVNLSQANLSDTDLRKTNLSEAILVNVLLDKAVVDQNWPDKLEQWQPTGVKEIRGKYKMVSDTADKFKTPLFRLRKVD